MVFLITPQNQELLLQARTEIDGPFKTEKGQEQLRKEVEKFATREGHAAYVFIKDGQVAGYVEFKHHEDEAPPGSPPIPILNSLGHIARIGVRKEYRREKIGSRLLEAAENWLRSAGLPGVWLDYYTDKLAAGALYAMNGYADIVKFQDPTTNPPRQRKIARKTW